MPEDKPIDSIKIDFKDLNTYRDNLPSNETSNSSVLTNFLMLESECQTKGLKALNDSLNSPTKPTTIEQIRENHSKELLEDLEKLTKTSEFQVAKELKRGEKIPEFKKEFYNEITKPENERSPELNRFIKACSELMPDINKKNDLTVPALISARMLVEMDKSETASESLKNKLKIDLDGYKEKHRTQIIRDVGSKESDGKILPGDQVIVFKDKNGARLIDLETLKNDKSLPLTGEQRDFIASSWHQGTFGSGTLSNNILTTDQRDQVQEQGLVRANEHNDFLIIDTSNESKITVCNRVKADIMFDVNKAELVPYVEAVLEVDITNLKGKDFTPGCASEMPKMNVYITELNKDFRFEVPEKLKVTRGLEHDALRDPMKEAKENACINEITKEGPSSSKAFQELASVTGIDKKILENFNLQVVSEGPPKTTLLEGLKKIPISEIQNLPNDAKIETLAVKCYKKVEKNPEKRLDFAKGELAKYCDKQDIKVLDTKETERLKKAAISILTPAIKDEKEKDTLENNIGAAIRNAAKQENIEMSFKQKLKAAFDSVFKSSKAQETIKKFEALKNIFQQPGSQQSSSSKNGPSIPSNSRRHSERHSASR